jgi:CHASE2 domain-containing sensor protein
VAAGQAAYSVRSDRQGIVGLQIGTSLIPTDRDGKVRLYYSPAHGARRVSAAAILRGVLGPKALANQVAIVGASAVGISDVAATPVSARMDGVEIHAHDRKYSLRLSLDSPTQALVNYWPGRVRRRFDRRFTTA